MHMSIWQAVRNSIRLFMAGLGLGGSRLGYPTSPDVSAGYLSLGAVGARVPTVALSLPNMTCVTSTAPARIWDGCGLVETHMPAEDIAESKPQVSTLF